MNDSAPQQGIEGLQAALAARATVQGWAEGAHLLELVRAAHRAGWLDLLRDGPVTTARLAEHTGVPAEQVADVLAVLTSAGVVDEQDSAHRLSPTFAALVTGASGVDVPTALGAADLARDRIAQSVLPAAQRRELDGEQALVLARDWGVRTTPGTRQLYGMLYEALPEYRDRLERGGPLLDVGSGVGGALLTTLDLFTGLRAVGVEIAPEVTADLTARARDLGVADRVDIRTADARRLDDESTFTACYWAQAFFPAGARADAPLCAKFAGQAGSTLRSPLFALRAPATTAAPTPPATTAPNNRLFLMGGT